MAEGTKAFAIDLQLAKLRGAYPRPQDLLTAAAAGPRERAILARLWISEGIPFAFRRYPAVYEELRDSLANGLNLDAKQINIGGSGRLGYSLAPKTWGEPYRPTSSDLDLFVVSERLFGRLQEDFERWRDDYDHGDAQPRTDGERHYWSVNRIETPERMRRGFVDSIRVPNRRRYAEFSAMNSCLAYVRHKLLKMVEGPKPRSRLTLRCYRDWDSYELQMTVSLKAVVNHLT